MSPSLNGRPIRHALFTWIAALVVLALAVPAAAALPKLIPREVLFGNPSKATPRLSPDGQRLGYLSPSKEGVLNVWVRTVGKDDDRMVTRDTHRGIRAYFWAEDDKHLLYIQDLNGDENWHLYSVDLQNDLVRDLTPFQGVRTSGIQIDRHFPDEILVGLNLRDRRLFDMHRVDLTTGAIVLDTENPGDVAGWVSDPDFQIRAAVASDPKDGSTLVRVRDSKASPWRELLRWPFGEEGGLLDFTADGKALFAITTLGSDTTRLVKIDVATGKELETLASNPKCDVGMPLYQEATHVVQAVEFEYARPEWKVLDPSIQADFDFLAKVHKGIPYVRGRDNADRYWIVTYMQDDGPTYYYRYSREEKKADFLFVGNPEFEKYTWAKREPVILKSRDGLDLVSYLTLPAGVEPKNLPLVLFVHGGPWTRDSWGFDPEAQWLANRGYAVLQVNYRASSGFGKSFLNAGNGQWGRAMQDDLTDAVKWAIAQGYADPKRIGIYGGSYGGYATLAGLAFTPDLYACGVELVGPANLKTFMDSIPAYWEPLRKQMTLRLGDVESDDALNRKISPLFHVDAIRAPLLIGQGANDPRVNIRESTQIVEAMRARKLPVDYVVYTDEGHGFARPENNFDFYGRADVFLSKYLGGRSEPWTKVEGATAEVR